MGSPFSLRTTSRTCGSKFFFFFFFFSFCLRHAQLRQQLGRFRIRALNTYFSLGFFKIPAIAKGRGELRGGYFG